jgi:spore coat protein CotF
MGISTVSEMAILKEPWKDFLLEIQKMNERVDAKVIAKAILLAIKLG